MKAQQTGKYRQRISLQAMIEIKDGYGQLTQDWQTIREWWAEVRFLRGQELLNVRQAWATASHIITCRYQGASLRPNPTMRFILGKDARIFNILAWQNVEERDRQWIFTCEEHVT